MAEQTTTPHPRAPRTPARVEVKMFTVELNGQGEGAIPVGWRPFQVRPTDSTSGVPKVFIWAYR